MPVEIFDMTDLLEPPTEPEPADAEPSEPASPAGPDSIDLVLEDIAGEAERLARDESALTVEDRVMALLADIVVRMEDEIGSAPDLRTDPGEGAMDAEISKLTRELETAQQISDLIRHFQDASTRTLESVGR